MTLDGRDVAGTVSELRRGLVSRVLRSSLQEKVNRPETVAEDPAMLWISAHVRLQTAK